MENMENQIFSKIGTLLVKSKNILIFLPASPTVDTVASGLALYLSLKAIGKKAKVVCANKLSVGFNRLIAVDKVANEIGGQNLVISFDYVEDSIEKVSYNIRHGKFNLVIQPKEGYPPLNTQNLNYSYTGAQADLIFALGCQKPEAIGKFYEEEKKLFEEQETINLDINHFNTRWGKTNFVDHSASSCSELIGLLMKNLNMTINPDIATNLLAGMEVATRNFSFKTRAETFAIVAWAMQAGGRRSQMQPTIGHEPLTPQPFPANFQSPAKTSPVVPFPFLNQGWFQPVNQPAPSFETLTSQVKPSSQNLNLSPTNTNLNFNLEENPSLQKSELADQSPSTSPTAFSNQTSEAKTNEEVPPPDWLKPKIYKTSNQV